MGAAVSATGGAAFSKRSVAPHGAGNSDSAAGLSSTGAFAHAATAGGEVLAATAGGEVLAATAGGQVLAATAGGESGATAVGPFLMETTGTAGSSSMEVSAATEGRFAGGAHSGGGCGGRTSAGPPRIGGPGGGAFGTGLPDGLQVVSCTCVGRPKAA